MSHHRWALPVAAAALLAALPGCAVSLFSPTKLTDEQRIDSLEQRVERIEKRVGIQTPPPPQQQ